MFNSYQYAYLFGNLFIAFPFWLLFFLYRRDLQKEMLLVSLIGGIAGPISQFWYLQDYWKPETFTGTVVGVEDFLFGFFIAGISAVIYEELFGKHFARRVNRRHHWSMFLIPILGVFTFSFNIPFLLGVNSIYASAIAFLVIAGIFLVYRRDLIADMVMSGLLVGGIMFVAYLIYLSMYPEAIHRWWALENISGILISGIPIEELLWAFGWGTVGGPVYEFFMGLRFKK
jgi:hypothetical protein